MYKLASMTLERSGEVIFRVKGNNHCGPKASVKAGHITAHWTFVAECAPSLDAHGFLFDQASLGDFVDKVAKHEPYDSCEHLARDLAMRFLAHLARNVPTCLVHNLTVTISPDPYAASLSVRYEHDDDSHHIHLDTKE